MNWLHITIAATLFYVGLGVYVFHHQVPPHRELPCQPLTTGVSIAKANAAWLDCAKAVANQRKSR